MRAGRWCILMPAFGADATQELYPLTLGCAVPARMNFDPWSGRAAADRRLRRVAADQALGGVPLAVSESVKLRRDLLTALPQLAPRSGP